MQRTWLKKIRIIKQVYRCVARELLEELPNPHALDLSEVVDSLDP
jgi:hypothetical protein